MALPLIPLAVKGAVVVGGGALGYGAYKGASEGARAVILWGALIGAGYLIYKRGAS